MTELNTSLQHIQIPNNMTEVPGIEPFDLYVYANIKRYMNHQSKEAWPSMQTLKRVMHSGQDKILESINRLKGKYFSIAYRDNKKVYIFSREYSNFEPISMRFLDNPNLTSLEKSYIIATQQYMFKDFVGLGKTSIPTSTLADMIGMAEWAIYKCDKSLQSKGYLDIVRTRKKDFITGLPIPERIFHMDKMGQGVIWDISGTRSLSAGPGCRVSQVQKDIRMLHKLLTQKDEEIERLSSSETEYTDLIISYE